MNPKQSEADFSETAAVAGFQFSVRAMMIATFAAGCWFGVLRITPHIAILIFGVFLAAVSVFLVVRLRRRGGSSFSRLSAYAFTIVAWFCFYVVSIGPIIAFNERVLDLDHDIYDFIYGPVFWLHDTTPLKEPIEQYAELWGWR